jgi:hypothetical protein
MKMRSSGNATVQRIADPKEVVTPKIGVTETVVKRRVIGRKESVEETIVIGIVTADEEVAEIVIAIETLNATDEIVIEAETMNEIDILLATEEFYNTSKISNAIVGKVALDSVTGVATPKWAEQIAAPFTGPVLEIKEDASVLLAPPGHLTAMASLLKSCTRPTWQMRFQVLALIDEELRQTITMNNECSWQLMRAGANRADVAEDWGMVEMTAVGGMQTKRGIGISGTASVRVVIAVTNGKVEFVSS